MEVRVEARVKAAVEKSGVVALLGGEGAGDGHRRSRKSRLESIGKLSVASLHRRRGWRRWGGYCIVAGEGAKEVGGPA